MKGPFSLADELRAIRGGVNSRNTQKRSLGQTDSGRPWQADFERVQSTLGEVLHAISNLSGVDLSKDGAGANGTAPSHYDCATLKDRIRKELESFSETTVSQLSRQAELQARAALAAIESDVRDKIEEFAGECRQKLKDQMEPEQLEIDLSKQTRDRVSELVQNQTDEFARWVWLTCKGTGTPIPRQIELMMEPYVEEATTSFATGMEQRIRELLDKQEKSIQDRLQGTIGSLGDQVNSLEQAAQQICERNADSVTKMATERLNTTADEAAKSFETRIQDHIEDTFGQMKIRMDETTASLGEKLQQESDQSAQGLIRRMNALAAEIEETKVAEVAARVEQAAAAASESSLQRLQQDVQELESHSRDEMKACLQTETANSLQQIQEASRSAQESMEQGAAAATDRLKGLDEEIACIREKHIVDSRGQITSMVQEAMGSLEPRIQELATARMIEANEAAQKAQKASVEQFESRLREVSEGQYRDLLERVRKDAGEAGEQAAAEVRNASHSALQDLSDKVNISASLLREQQAQASSEFESSVKDTLENFRSQLAQITEAGMAEHRKTVAENVFNIQARLKQAADLLMSGIPGAP